MPFTGNYCFMASLCTFAGSQIRKKKKSLQTCLKEQTNHVKQSVLLTLTIKLLTSASNMAAAKTPARTSEKLRRGEVSAAEE